MAVQTDLSLFDLPERKRELVRGPPQQTLPPKVVVREPTFDEMQKYAQKSGFTLEPLARPQKELQDRLAGKLTATGGAFGAIYQSPNFSINNFSRAAAEALFAHVSKTSSTPSTACWKVKVPSPMIHLTLGLEKVHVWGMGSSKAFKLPSETFIRLVASYFILKFTHVTTRSKRFGTSESIKVKAMYIQMDEDGEISKPKNSERKEMTISEQTEADIRALVLQDVSAMARARFPLSSKWLLRLAPEFVVQGNRAAAKEARMLRNGGVDPSPTPPPSPPGSEQSWSEGSEVPDSEVESLD